MTTAEIGKKGEKLAANFLKRNGYKILERNLHQSHNEIDIIAANKEYIVFVEVKTRTANKDLFLPYGSPATAVTKEKQKRTVRAATNYLLAQSKKAKEKQPRMDVIEVYLEKETGKLLEINHITDAFGAR